MIGEKGVVVSSISNDIFHLSDIRADSSFFTNDVIDKLTQAEALFFKENLSVKTVILARDARLSGNRILERKCQIFLSLGFDVILFQNPISTPFFYFASMQNPNAAGIMISASHNPKNHNGEKLVGPNCIPIAGNYEKTGELDIIRKYFENDQKLEISRTKGSLLIEDYKKAYLDFAINYLNLQDTSFSTNILFDFLSGSSSVELLDILSRNKSFSFKNFIPNGEFPQGDPNPIKQTIKEFDSDYLIMFDGDGDRMDVINKDLKEIPPSAIFAFILPVLSKGKGIVCLDPKASPVIINYLNENGYTTMIVPNGHSQIKKILSKNKSIIAAVEESGHYYLNIKYNDFVYSIENMAIILLAFLSSLEKDKKSLEYFIKLTSSYYREREWTKKFDSALERSNKLKQIEALLLTKGYNKTDTVLDGSPLGSVILKKDEKPWVQVTLRASETELYLARFEVLSELKDEAEKIKVIIEDVLSRQMS